jgi:hypothetical protein
VLVDDERAHEVNPKNLRRKDAKPQRKHETYLIPSKLFAFATLRPGFPLIRVHLKII